MKHLVLMMSVLGASVWSAGCSDDSPIAPKGIRLAEPFEIRVGETVQVEPEGIRLSFHSVSQDSRCPTGVTCVWEGDAVVQLKVAKDSEDETHIDLHTNRRFNSKESYNGFVVRLLDLAPYPKANMTIRSTAYWARLEVARSSD